MDSFIYVDISKCLTQVHILFGSFIALIGFLFQILVCDQNIDLHKKS